MPDRCITLTARCGHLVNLQGLPYMPPNLVANFDPETAENGWRVFARRRKFSHWETASLTAWTLYNRQQATFTRVM